MKTTLEYLDEAKLKLGITSDNQLALHLGLTRASISDYRHKRSTMDPYTATQIAIILDIDPMLVIATANIEREKDGKRREFWENFSKRISGIAAAVLLTASMAYDIDLKPNNDIDILYIMRIA